MIRIDHLSFGFVATDEQFTQGLYADWDSFCRTCVEKVMEECLSVYDKEKVLYEIKQLNLNLGSIPEEDFYREFPRKLREELQRALPLLNISAGNREESTDVSRLENLLFYLEHGYPKLEWSDKGFNLTEELEWIATQPATYIHKISRLCLSKEHILRRLLWQADNEAVLLRLYAAALTEPTASLYEKRNFLIMFLETKPIIPIRFIHEAENETRLQEMSELLDTLSIRQIMDTECREHTEVDLPPYWHYLYEWLIRYYPFNGLAIFGSKGDFIHYLHHRLLTFIRKRRYSFYFSKVELTLGFLLEVFGPVYYIEVLNAIYNLQPHHSDGSPLHDNYYNLELYRTFLNLSLLRRPLAKEGKEISISEKAEDSSPLDLPSLTGGSTFYSTALSQALLLDMQDAETVHSFVQSLPTLQDKVEAERNKIEHNVKQILNIMEERSYFNEEEQREVSNNFFITNAGLCLFNPWFPRLFIMLDYLDKDKKVFKDTASQIRAVFLLQYLTCLEEKTYQEMELMFNRQLVDLPMQIPLPKQLELTSEEKNTAENLLKAVKANWGKMNGTSMNGFLEAFIHRNGRLELQKEKWLLTIEDRGYDILLASVPWSFKQMRYPWLEKYIQVIWHDKHTF